MSIVQYGGLSAAGGGAALLDPPEMAVPLQRVLVGMDFGVPAVRALEWVAEHLTPAAKLHLVYAVDPQGGPSGPGSGERMGRSEIVGLSEQATRHLEDLARGVSPGRCSIEVRVGTPREELINAARDWGADLISVGPHTHPGGARRGLGSTAELLLACSPVPVMLSTRVHLSKPTRLLALVPDSRFRSRVLSYAQALARELRAQLRVEKLTHGRSKPPLGGRIAGRPGHRVVELLEGDEIDLLVLGTHKRRPSRSLLEGTVRAVLAATPCPVLLVSSQTCEE